MISNELGKSSLVPHCMLFAIACTRIWWVLVMKLPSTLLGAQSTVPVFCLLIGCSFSSCEPLLAETDCCLFKVEVLFDWPWNAGPRGPPSPGDPVLPFSLAIAIGTATSMAAYLTAIFAKKLDLLNNSLSSRTWLPGSSSAWSYMEPVSPKTLWRMWSWAA